MVLRDYINVIKDVWINTILEFNLAEHPWVKAALDKAFLEHYHITKIQFI